MMRTVMLSAILGLALGVATAEATDRRSGGTPGIAPGHAKSDYYSGGPQVRGSVQRRGGYSYSYSDTINTYGDSRTLYGSANVYRDPMLDRQSSSGPFDHGFFFDSGISPRGGNSPYPN